MTRSRNRFSPIHGCQMLACTESAREAIQVLPHAESRSHGMKPNLFERGSDTCRNSGRRTECRRSTAATLHRRGSAQTRPSPENLQPARRIPHQWRTKRAAQNQSRAVVVPAWPWFSNVCRLSASRWRDQDSRHSRSELLGTVLPAASRMVKRRVFKSSAQTSLSSASRSLLLLHV